MNLLEIINNRFKGKVEVKEDALQPTVYVEKDNLIEVIKTLKEDEELSFKLLADLTAVDYVEYFEVIYHLMSFKTSEMLRIKVKLDRNNPEISSLSNLWKAAIDQERETYDLLGINFTNHPNLTRILCPEDFEGHPLRKDFQQ